MCFVLIIRNGCHMLMIVYEIVSTHFSLMKASVLKPVRLQKLLLILKAATLL